MRLHLFLILALFFHVSAARAAKVCEQWVSGGGVIVQNMPLSGLLETGVAHLKVPGPILKNFVHPELSAEDIDRHFDIADEVGIEFQPFILEELRKALPGYDVEYHRRFATGGGGLGTNWSWHRDGRGHQDPQTIESIHSGRLEEFSIRVIFPLPININPPTVLLPAGGEFKDLPLQGTNDHFTIFVKDVIEHSVPIAPKGFKNLGRSALSYDYKVTRRLCSAWTL